MKEQTNKPHTSLPHNYVFIWGGMRCNECQKLIKVKINLKKKDKFMKKNPSKTFK